MGGGAPSQVAFRKAAEKVTIGAGSSSGRIAMRNAVEKSMISRSISETAPRVLSLHLRMPWYLRSVGRHPLRAGEVGAVEVGDDSVGAERCPPAGTGVPGASRWPRPNVQAWKSRSKSRDCSSATHRSWRRERRHLHAKWWLPAAVTTGRIGDWRAVMS